MTAEPDDRLQAPAARWLPGTIRLGRLIGLLILSLLVAIALLGPTLSGRDAISQDLEQVRQPPSQVHWLGTDHLGRDQLARLGSALLLSLVGGTLAVLCAAGFGCALGLLAAWRGGVVESLAVAMADAALALPGLVLVLLLSALSPGSIILLNLSLALVMWMEYFRLTRAQARVLLASPAVENARLLGFGPGFVVRHHLLPELAPMIGTLMCYGVAGVVLAMAALGFVGVGLHPPAAELGVMLVELFPYYEEAPWLIAAPAASLVLLLASLVLLAGDRDPR